MNTPIPRFAALIGLYLAVCAPWTPLHAQQVYKIVGPDGKVTFSDRPPPTDAAQTKVIQNPASGSTASAGASGAPLPNGLQLVVAKYPVTLYTGNDCAPCDQGRNLLKQRGVPFTEKTVNTSEDALAFQKIGTNGNLPLLMLGAQPIHGFAAAEWNNYLDAAGYPKTSILSAGYRNPPAQPLVPPKPVDPNAPATAPAATASDANAAAPNTRKPRPAPVRKVDDTNPAGIKF